MADAAEEAAARPERAPSAAFSALPGLVPAGAGIPLPLTDGNLFMTALTGLLTPLLPAGASSDGAPATSGDLNEALRGLLGQAVPGLVAPLSAGATAAAGDALPPALPPPPPPPPPKAPPSSRASSPSPATRPPPPRRWRGCTRQ